MGFFKRFTRPKAKLSLTTDKQELSLGEELRGNLSIQAEEEFDIEGITVKLNCWESVKETIGYRRTTTQTGGRRKSTMDLPEFPSMNGEDDEENEREEHFEKEEEWNYQKLHSQSLQLCGEMHVNVGFSKEFPFVVKMPTVGRETFHSVNKNVKWLISATMNIKGCRHMETRRNELLVAKPTESVKEVVREVVLIPCSYCGGLMPQTSLFCPNCGARRRPQ
jgi:hypothetical protein